MTETKIKPRIVPCRPDCGCAFCDVEREGGETIRTAAREIMRLWDRGTILIGYNDDSSAIVAAFTNLRDHLK